MNLRSFGPGSVLCLGFAVSLCLASCSGNPESTKREHLESGDKFFKEKKYNEAIVAYRSAITIDGRFGEAHAKLAKAYEEKGELGKAFEAFQRAADVLQDDLELQVTAGRYLVKAGRFEDAKAKAETVIARDPKNVGAQILLGSALLGLKDVEGAVREVEEAIRIDPLDPNTYTSIGMLQTAVGDAARAEKAFLEAVRLSPKSTEARISLASFYWLAQRTQDSEKTLLEAIAIEPDNELANRTTAAFYIQTKRPAQAEPFLKRLAARNGDGRSKLALADFYSSSGRRAEAMTILTALQSDPAEGPKATIRLAVIAYGDRRTTEAHRMLDELIEKGGAISHALVLKGRFLLAENRIDQAIDRLKSAAEADPSSASARYLLGNAYYARNDLAAAVTAYRESLKISSRSVTTQLQLARVLFLAGKHDESRIAAEEALRVQPDNPVARLMLADALMGKKDMAKARAQVDVLKKEYPKYAASHVLEGKLLTLNKDFAGARRAFAEALKIDPNMAEAMMGYINAEIGAGDVAQARQRVEAMLQRAPDDPALRMLAARIYMLSKEPQRAEAVLQALVGNTASSQVRGMLGEVYLSQGRFDEALVQFEALAALEPRSVAAHTMIAMVLHGQKRVDEAKARYEKVLELDPAAANAANNLAFILAEKREHLNRALSLAKQAVALQPDNPEFNDTLGWVYYKMSTPALAIEPLERAVKANPDNPGIQFHLGLAYAALGNGQQARARLQRALVLSPQFDGAAEAKKKLSELEDKGLVKK